MRSLPSLQADRHALFATIILLSFLPPLHTLCHHPAFRSLIRMNLRYQLHLACFLLALVPISARADVVRVYVTNSAGDSIHIIDAGNNKVVQETKGIEGTHGIAFSPH